MSAFHRLREGHPGPDAALRVLAASGQLGLGMPEDAFRRGVAASPHVIAADMGSTDPGPAYLGSGDMAAPEDLALRDLRLVLSAARSLDAPLLIGSAGTAGAAPHLARVRDLVARASAEEGLSFRLATIASDIPPDRVARAMREDRLRPIGEIPLGAEALAETTHIVAQAGLEPFRAALEAGADVILAGRACDTAPFAVIPVMLGYPRGPATHMAKIVECASLACEPGGRDAILATLEGDAFTLESMNPARAATPRSVAAHALYEQADPFEILEPEGRVRLDAARYEALDARRVRVSGAAWEPAGTPTLKIEGARPLGHRAVMLAAAADPEFIARSGAILAAVEAEIRELMAGDWRIDVRRYGIDGVLDWPAPPEAPPREIFLLGSVLADDAGTARSVLAAFRQRLLHHGFEGRRATGGNLAFPLAPPELDAGPAWAFSIYHVMELDGPGELSTLFPVTLETIGGQT